MTVLRRLAPILSAIAAALPLVCDPLSPGAMAAARPRPDPVPVPQNVISRAAPLKTAKTALMPFDTAPFPYNGTVPTTGKPFIDVITDTGRKAHTTPGGRTLWQDETFSDRRVLLHIPKGFDVRKPSVMIVFLHGHGATLERDVRDRQRVPAQVSASGANAVLVAPQLAFDARDSSAGKFWEPGGFGRFVGEAAQKLAALHGDRRSVRTFASMPVVIVAYSGGYLPAAACAQKGGLKKRLRGIVLLDALYGELDTFARFIRDDPSAFFVSAYLGSTRDENAQFETLLASREIPMTESLDGRLKQGSVTILPAAGAAPSVTHRDLVSRAWVDNPIQDLLARMREFRR